MKTLDVLGTGFRVAAVMLVVLCAATLVACGDSDPIEIEEVRERHSNTAPPPANIDAATRLGLGSDPHAHVPGMEGAFGAGGGAVKKPKFTWQTPEGWVTLPPMPAVEVGFGVGGHPDARMTVSFAGGAIADNVNRWRRQMGLAPAPQAEIEGLPRHQVLGQSGLLVDLEGSFTGMRGNALPDARMLGIFVPRSRQSVFLKLIGPSTLVAAERQRFLDFAGALREAAPGSGMGAAHGTAGGTPPGPTPVRPPRAIPPAKLEWDLPPKWKELPSRPPRMATFQPEGAAAVQCLVTVLSGSGGGLAQNLNEWRRQLGLEPLTDESYVKLERSPVLGVTAVFMEIEGQIVAKPGAEPQAATLFGAIAPRERDTVFVKMWGPTAEMEGQQANFRALVDSLRE